MHEPSTLAADSQMPRYAEPLPCWKWARLIVVLVVLCCCYFGKYFCSSDMYIANTMFMKDTGFSPQRLSQMFAVGYFCSIFGKLFAGALCDAIGGRFVIIVAAMGYVCCTWLLSTVSDGPLAVAAIFIAWAGIGFFGLGLAWVAVVAVATNWIPRPYLGRLMGVVSMAPQLGDAIARLSLASSLNQGWRAVFRTASFDAFVLLLPVLLFIPNRPPETIEEFVDPLLSPRTPVERFDNYRGKLKLLLAQPFLWVLCLLSGSLYGTRTLFLLYSTSFLARVYCQDVDEMTECLSSGKAMTATALASSGFTILGCASVLLVGFMKDKLPNRHRGVPLFLGTAPLFCMLTYLTTVGPDLPYQFAATIVASTGFCLFGPYKILGSVFAVDVGGKSLKSTCTGLMGVSDNIFAILMLIGKGTLGDDWRKMFSVLAFLSCISLTTSVFVWRRDLHIVRQNRRQSSALLLSSEL